MRIAILGATSAIAEAVARLYAKNGASLVLVARNEQKLRDLARDLRARGAQAVTEIAADLAVMAGHQNIVERILDSGPIDVVLHAYGSLPYQKSLEANPVEVAEAMNVNATSAMALIMLLANEMERAQRGTIAMIGSVAGDRGRNNNYVYAAAKGALERFAEGLRARLSQSGVHVLLIKPGWVTTPMTVHKPDNILFVTAESAGASIYRAIRSRRSVVYVPWYWRILMAGIRAIPTRLFNRMRF